MKLTGTRFSTIEYEAEDVVTFSEGLVGFSEYHDFVLVSPKKESPFRWLQSLNEPKLAFLLADPSFYVADYAPSLSDPAATSLELEQGAPTLVFTTATIPPGDPQGLTLNLSAPIIVNAVTRRAAQVVLEDAAYTMKHRVFQEANQVSQSVAA